MRTIGLLGGMSWESTAVYYRRINEEVRNRLGGLNSAEVLMRSVNFDHIVALQRAGHWDQAAAMMAALARDLEASGAACIVICTNTMHKLADSVQEAVSVPVLHIADVTAAEVMRAGLRRPLVLATRYTMEQDFYVGRLRDKFNLDPLVPDEAGRTVVHQTIFDELCQGIVRDSSRQPFRDIIARGRTDGADCVILGCTEIGLLIGDKDTDLPVFDSTLIHADTAVRFSLANDDASRLSAA